MNKFVFFLVLTCLSLILAGCGCLDVPLIPCI